QDHLHVRIEPTKLGDHLLPGHGRHVVVEEKQVDLLLPQEIERLDAAGRGEHLVPLALEKSFRDLQVVDVVVREQNRIPGRLLRCSLACHGLAPASWSICPPIILFYHPRSAYLKLPRKVAIGRAPSASPASSPRREAPPR